MSDPPSPDFVPPDFDPSASGAKQQIEPLSAGTGSCVSFWQESCVPTVLRASLDLPRPNVEEDAPPLLWFHERMVALGVFDGLGGAGARFVQGPHGRHTSAWYAARLARAAVVATLRSWESGYSSFPQDSPSILSEAIAYQLSGANTGVSTASSVVRGTLIRSYPTAAALLLFQATADGVNLRALWAGDSRCYLLDQTNGLQQITRDHSRTGADPMTALREESPLSRMLTADGQCTLDSRQLVARLPVVLLAASDGCFSCFRSPMHFERVLIEALDAAEDENAWIENLRNRLQPIASDDISLAAAFVGWTSLRQVRAALASRHKVLKKMLNPIDGYFKKSDDLRAKADQTRTNAEAELAQAWTDYRRSYMTHLNDNAGPT